MGAGIQSMKEEGRGRKGNLSEWKGGGRGQQNDIPLNETTQIYSSSSLPSLVYNILKLTFSPVNLDIIPYIPPRPPPPATFFPSSVLLPEKYIKGILRPS